MVSAGMRTWLLEVMGCARRACGGKLALVLGAVTRRGAVVDGMLACARCRASYPVVGGVPLLVPDPASWSRSYHDAALAALAEQGLASRSAVAMLRRFAVTAGAVEPMRFGDDWVEPAEPEAGGPAGPAVEAFRAFLTHAEASGVADVARELLPARGTGTVVEIGCGDGCLSRGLRKGAERVVLCDLSLRAVLRARAQQGKAAPPLAVAVADAEQLPLRRRAVDTLLGLHLVDLLDRPEPFLEAAAAGLKRGGRLVVSTPEPELGSADPGMLTRLVEEAGLRVDAERDGIPWVHAHRPRYYQVYFSRLVVARRP